MILLSDLRDFTTFSDRLPGEAVIRLLNGYFDCLVPAIEAQGGEVLKFIGDGLLGIFPVADDPAAACRAALAAAGRRQGRARADQRRAGRSRRAAAALWPGAASRRGPVRQHRQRRAARLHHDRPGGQPDRAPRDAGARSRARPRGLGRVRRALPRSPDLARPLRAARLSRAPGGVRPGRPVSVADALHTGAAKTSPSRGAPATRQTGRAVQAQKVGPFRAWITPRSGAG